MRGHAFAGFAILVGPVAAQNLFSSLVSDATSIYGQVTSMLGQTSTSDSSSPTTATSDSSDSSNSPTRPTSSSSSQSSITSTDSSTSSSSTSSPSVTSTNATSSAATPTSSAALASATAKSSSTATPTLVSGNSSSHGGGINGKTLGIILGCVLGVLLLILLILLLFCCRRRRRRRYYGSSRVRSSSPGEKGLGTVARPRSRSPSLNGAYAISSKRDHPVVAPLSSNPTNGNDHVKEAGNPFVPIPPPPRRKPIPGQEVPNKLQHSAPPYAAGDFADRYYQNPQSPHGGYDKPPLAGENVRHQAINDAGLLQNDTNFPNHSSHHQDHGKALAVGAGGLALGAIAANAAHHEHHDEHHNFHDSTIATMPNEKREKRFSEMDDMTLPQVVTDPPLHSLHHEQEQSRHSAGLTTSPSQPLTSDEDGTTAVNSTVAESVDRKSKNSSRARRRSWSLGRDRSVSTEGTSRRKLTPTLPLLVGTGAGVAAAATASRKNRNGSKSPHRRGILKQTTSSTSSSNDYGDVQDRATPDPAMGNGPHELTDIDIPPTPPLRERASTPLGTAAPAAAAASYIDGRSTPPTQHRRYSITGPNIDDHPPVPPLPAVLPTQDTRRHTMPPTLGQRSIHISRQQYPESQSVSREHNSGYQPPMSRREMVSPDLEPYQGVDYDDDLMSPVSPVTASQSGTLTQAEAASLAAAGFGPNHEPMSDRFTSQSPPFYNHPHGPRNSGLVSAVQEAFPAVIDERKPKSIVGDNGYPHHGIPRRMSGGEYDSSETGPLGPQVIPVPRRRHAPWAQGEAERSSSSDSTYRTSLGAARGRESVASRKSGDSGRYPPRSYNNTSRSVRSRSSSRNSRQSNNNASLPGTPRRLSRPGYGYGSGDPFDLATMRTDSNMTGYSVVPADNYEVQQHRRSRANSAESKHRYGGAERPEDRYERLSRQPDDDFGVYSGSDVGLAY